MTKQSAAISVQCISTQDYQMSDIDYLYQQLFSGHTSNNFFLSHDWMKAWLESLNNKPELIKFSIQGNLVGFVFLGNKKGPWGTSYYLNQSGKEDEDQVWIEYNDIICKTAHKLCRQALLDHLSNKKGVFKLVVCNSIAKSWEDKKWGNWSNQIVRAYKTKLKSNDPTSHYSKNTKKQLIRAKRYIESTYGMVLMKNVNEDGANNALANIAELHKRKWAGHPLGSGFNNAKFVNFHKSLVNKCLNTSVHILKFSADELELGYLYYFASNKRAYFYLSAINYADSHNNFKPGLLMHTMAMQYFVDLGFVEYDFLAGYARYKTSLSNSEYSFNTIHIFRNKWYYRPIRQLVSVRRWFTKTFFEK